MYINYIVHLCTVYYDAITLSSLWLPLYILSLLLLLALPCAASINYWIGLRTCRYQCMVHANRVKWTQITAIGWWWPWKIIINRLQWFRKMPNAYPLNIKAGHNYASVVVFFPRWNDHVKLCLSVCPTFADNGPSCLITNSLICSILLLCASWYLLYVNRRPVWKYSLERK